MGQSEILAVRNQSATKTKDAKTSWNLLPSWCMYSPPLHTYCNWSYHEGSIDASTAFLLEPALFLADC